MGFKVGAFGISESEFRMLNQPNTENTVRLRDEQGGGFYVMIEVFHQLHCLVNLTSQNILLLQSAALGVFWLIKAIKSSRIFYGNSHTRNIIPLEILLGQTRLNCSAPMLVRNISHNLSHTLCVSRTLTDIQIIA